MTRMAAAGRLRLLLLAVIVSVVLGVVAMHQLASGHDGHDPAPAAVVIRAMGSGSGSSVGSTAPRLAPAHDVGAMTAGCVLLLVLTALRPARRAGVGHPIPRRSAARRRPRVATPRVRARAPTRLQPSVCRT